MSKWNTETYKVSIYRREDVYKLLGVKEDKKYYIIYDINVIKGPQVNDEVDLESMKNSIIRHLDERKHVKIYDKKAYNINDIIKKCTKSFKLIKGD